uniref:GHMP kinase n=2 Tax=Methylocapsa acidiphila TaxID=133552 RepID=Q2VNP3_METAI|nr:beta-ribofuranosylaminobenzene 5'-phosphate synthase family protein [Methylocapsa acidiphila]CAJ01589.1 conserved hypothetical protein [Methylocapsa acidiphila]
MFDSVTATAFARLHLGFLDMNGGLGRRFGSLGLAIDGRATRLSIRRAAGPRIEGPEAARASSHLACLKDSLRLASDYDLQIHEAIPAHAGLGSGTQLALIVAASVRRLECLPSNPAEDAILLQRGARSGIGAGLFERGGLIVDGGRGAQTATPPVIARLEFPEEWRVILVIDPHTEGAHGQEERAAFAQLENFAASAAGEICRLVLIKALPAVAEADLDSFGDAVTRIQDIVGDYFAPAQGGSAFASKAVGGVMETLRRHGAKGTGQSSWGPTGFAFARDADEAHRLCGLVQEKVKASSLDIAVCKGLNHGALVKGETFAAIK